MPFGHGIWPGEHLLSGISNTTRDYMDFPDVSRVFQSVRSFPEFSAVFWSFPDCLRLTKMKSEI